MATNTSLDDRIAVSIIIPAYNEAQVIGIVVHEVQKVMSTTHLTYEILVVDDGSSDETAEQALCTGARAIKHAYNIGNGAAIKTGIRNARGSILLMMDGDGQHNPQDIPRLLAEMQKFDMVVGARTRQSLTDNHRDFANAIYNGLASYICGRKIEDLTSGFRAIKSRIARGFVYLLPNTFSYPSSLTLSVARSGHTIRYIPITTTRRSGKSKINLLQDGLRFLFIILKIATFYSPMKVFLPVSAAILLLGVGYGLYRIFVFGSRYGQTSALLITAGILVFLIGLVSEQIAQLRFEHSEIIDNDKSDRIIFSSKPQTDSSVNEKKPAVREENILGKDEL